LDRSLAPGDVANRRTDQAEKMALDPVAREIVGDGEDEAIVGELEPARLPEPGPVRGVVERPPEPTGDFSPQALRSQLDLVLHPGVRSLRLVKRRERRAYQPAKTLQMASLCRCLPGAHSPSTAVEKGGGNFPFRLRSEGLACGKSGGRLLSILAAPEVPRKGEFVSHEAHLPAQRPPPQAQARLPHADVVARRPADPEAPPRQGPQAPLGVGRVWRNSGCAARPRWT